MRDKIEEKKSILKRIVKKQIIIKRTSTKFDTKKQMIRHL